VIIVIIAYNCCYCYYTTIIIKSFIKAREIITIVISLVILLKTPAAQLRCLLATYDNGIYHPAGLVLRTTSTSENKVG
jgi:hypothetical protein